MESEWTKKNLRVDKSSVTLVGKRRSNKPRFVTVSLKGKWYATVSLTTAIGRFQLSTHRNDIVAFCEAVLDMILGPEEDDVEELDQGRQGSGAEGSD